LQAIALQPQCADAYNNLGAALRGQGRLDEAGYAINPHGRYSHDAAYVRQALVDAGLGVLAIVQQVLRMEGGHPVHGLVVTAARVA
jgi:predicted TPR repeat methyltransferase